MDSVKQGEERLDAPEVAKGPFAKREEEILAFWNEYDVFKKSLEKPAPRGEYTFYDGPPFATGLPHYGHILQSTIKDAVPRYRTMRGYRVARRWGWDCHGLPLENQIEQELGFKTKRDIEQYGVEGFNLAAKRAVLRYATEWKRIIPRIGRWVDMEYDYKTMDATYTESVWWAFKNLYDRGLIYEGFKAMHLCPRCGTTLSNFEVASAYQDIEDYAVTVKLPLVDEPETSLLIWTTTPWTLPGNSAAAVNPEAVYVKARTDEGFVVVARDLATKVLGPEPKIYGEMLGRDLVGKYYEPPFSYFKDLVHKHKTHAWKIYAAPYVTTDSGTGIVHLAPAYGAEDLELAQKEKIPLIHHVTDEGKFIVTVADFAHMPVKPKGRHQETDAKIIALLTEKGLLFASEKVKHSYPHCWRCDSPLLNWASNSWFVNIGAIKPKLLAENKKVLWVPGHVGEGRFQNLLAGAPDWAISRSRYWGAPLPVWRHSKTKEVKVIGSVEELLPLVRRSGNSYFVMRHGQAQSNVSGVLDSTNDSTNHLTDVGRGEVRTSAEHLRTSAKIDMIVASPLLRTQETARIAQEVFGVPDAMMMTDDRLKELQVGTFDGKKLQEWVGSFNSFSERFSQAPEGGETYAEVRRRVGEFLFEIESRYAGKNILIVTHGSPSWLMRKVAARVPHKDLLTARAEGEMLRTGECVEMPFTPYPHNDEYDLDLHRPYIDDIALGNSLEGEWVRVPDVFDCWFESGSMPYASNAYPQETSAFNPRRLFGFGSRGYPAHFISEGIDQTRGWFYSLIVLGVALFGKSPYKAVVTNGLILAEDGRKMSKKLKNYPDPVTLVDTYGADALRYYLLSSTLNRGEDLRFSSRGVEEISKKLLMRLDNVRSFYDLYVPEGAVAPTHGGVPKAKHILDQWILSRLGELVAATTAGFEKYELDVATRPLAGFIDDLSTWYLRRSRDRFKEEGNSKDEALATLHFVLMTTAKVMAPTMPFFADDLYRRLRSSEDPESVHLCDWPEALPIDADLVTQMAEVRALCSEGLQLREKAGLKLRQPLATFAAKKIPTNVELHAVIASELNVKSVKADESLEGGWLDTALTPELREEGMLREVMRLVQDLRKQEGLTIADRPTLRITTTASGRAFFERHQQALIEETNLSAMEFEMGEGEVAENQIYSLVLLK